MASSEISPKDVVLTIQDLNENQTKELFYLLDVPLNVLDGIEGTHRGNMRKIYYVQAWFDREVQASWKQIVAGLRHMGMKALADSLASPHALHTTPTPGTVEPSPLAIGAVNSTSDPPTIFPAHPVNDGSAPPITSSSGAVERPLSSSSPSVRVAQVSEEIERLTDAFTDIMAATRYEMCTREMNDPSFLDTFRDRLLDLPVAQKASHARFFRQSEDDFMNARHVRKIFFILKRYCNYRNYDILQQVVSKFCSQHLQRGMQEYCQSLETFEKETAVDVYLKAISAGIILSSEFTKMAVKINRPATECTLHEIRKFKETLTERASLQPYSVYIGDMCESSVQLELGFHASSVGWALGVMTPDFLSTHLLSDVVVDEEQLSILEKTHEQLSAELMVASRDGEVMRVFSLLNSGASIQTAGGLLSATPLYYACTCGHLQVVFLLLSRGADMDYRDKLEWTPLMSAIVYGRYEVVAELICLGANVDLQDYRGDSPLMLACRYGRMDIAMELLQQARGDLNTHKTDSSKDRETILRRKVEGQQLKWITTSSDITQIDPNKNM